MKNVRVVWVLLGSMLFSLNGYSQSKAWIEFFSQSLSGEKEVAAPKGKSLKVKKIEQSRKAVWEAWVEANKTFEEDKLIPLDDLSKGNHGVWHLPENLEPKAFMNYYWGCKGEMPAEGYPMFLYLHGSGPKDSEWKTGLKLGNMFDDAPSVYFIPQIPNVREYYRWYQKSKQFAWERLIRQAMLRTDIDPNRLYLFGISEGGYGSQRLASFYADYLAAAGPMAGGEPLKNAPVENCRHIGFSLRTGAQDYGFYRHILTQYTHAAFDSLGHIFPGEFKHKIELIEGRGHSIDYSPTPVWLKQFVRNPWPKQISWEDFEMDGWYRRGFYNIVVLERPDKELRTRYDMDIKDNCIELSVQDVHYTTTQKDPVYGIEMKFERTYTPSKSGRLLIYLNEHLVDLNKPVAVTVNGREVFKGKVKCNEANMLRSLATFYDSQRIYPAAVEVVLE